MDAYETPFGVRTIEFTADNGFLLNGERVPLNGVCDHHDLGALGSALNTRALERQLQILQEMGCNAIRTSHNPPAPELLELCDRLGLVVMDEAFDCWVRGKKPERLPPAVPGLAREGPAGTGSPRPQSSLRHPLEHRQRNPRAGLSGGPQVAAELGGALCTPKTRPGRSPRPAMTRAAGYNGFQKQFDVFGYNYKPGEYGKFREANPAAAAVRQRDRLLRQLARRILLPRQRRQEPGQGRFPGQLLRPLCSRAGPRRRTPNSAARTQFPFVAGEFVWTGFDYLGEPTPYNGDTSNLLNFTDPAEKARLEKELQELGKIHVPSRSSYFGIIDLAGFKKDRFYLYQAHWRPDLPMAHILPHWNWPERVGQVTPVHVYTSGRRSRAVPQRQIARPKETRASIEYRLRWDDVVYQPGELKVVAYKHGKQVGQRTWSRPPAQPRNSRSIRTAPSCRPTDRTCPMSRSPSRTKQGRLVPRSHNHVAFELTGPGEIVAMDNGDATSFEPFQAKERNAYNGLCLAIVRSTGQPGPISLKATGPGLRPAKVDLKAK